MQKYLQNHIVEIRKVLDARKKTKTDWSGIRKTHRVKISFLQHERLVHLLITLFFGLFFLLLSLVSLMVEIPGILFIEPIVLILLIAYIWHYYQLENGVQKLYRLDDELTEKIK